MAAERSMHPDVSKNDAIAAYMQLISGFQTGMA